MFSSPLRLFNPLRPNNYNNKLRTRQYVFKHVRLCSKHTSKKNNTQKQEFTESKTDGSLEVMRDPIFRAEVLWSRRVRAVSVEDNPNITLTLRLLWYSNICTQIMTGDFKYVAVMLDHTLKNKGSSVFLFSTLCSATDLTCLSITILAGILWKKKVLDVRSTLRIL